MRTLFADSGHWIALLHPRDQMHERANVVATRLGPVWSESYRTIQKLKSFLRRTHNSRLLWSARPPEVTRTGA